ncbi:MAG: hypothetical protein KF773_36225 [Deltaproteobacteria bacterium]|nr:hypothetical protein [Deltaproteobacteria bacterium]
MVIAAALACACGGKDDASPAPAGSGSGGSAPAKAVEAAGSGSGSAAAPAQTELALGDGETRHEPPVEIVWELPVGAVTATLVDVRATPSAPVSAHRLVVWGGGKRHVVVSTKVACDKGAELWKAPRQRVVLRCESNGPTESTADLWLVRWNDKKAYPTRYRHWQGLVDEREPKWAASPQPKTGKGRGQRTSWCCCEFRGEEDTDLLRAVELRSMCTGADLAGRCVAEAKCRNADD